MLKPGAYKLTRNVENPKPDRRVKDDWRCHPVWKAGDEFLVEPVNYKERDDAPTSMWTRIVKVGHKWKHENLTANDTRYHALEVALEECEMSDRAFFTAHGIRDWFAQWLIHSGRMSRELFLKLWNEFEDDGQTPSAEPYAQRAPLVEAEVKPIGSYRLAIRPTSHSTTDTIREFTGTEVAAFTEAAAEIKAGSSYVRVEKLDDGVFKTIGELHLTPKNEQPKTLRDPGLREAFTRMRHGLDTVETAMRGLADELSVMLLESDIADGDKMIAHDNLIDRIYETITHGDESHREWLRAELNKFKHAQPEAGGKAP